MVDDKVTKMRETLRLMSLSRFNYTVSIFLTQLISGVISSVIVGAGTFGRVAIYPVEPVSRTIFLTVALIIFSVAMIPFSMSLSTVFKDIRMAN